MGWFNKMYDYGDEKTDELQAQLKGLCFKIIAQGYGLTDEMSKYEAIITELTRRNVQPVMTVVIKE